MGGRRQNAQRYRSPPQSGSARNACTALGSCRLVWPVRAGRGRRRGAGRSSRSLTGWRSSASRNTRSGLPTENDISLTVLPDLTDQDFKDIGVSLGRRRRCCVEIRRALALQHAPVLVMTHQGNLIAKWPRRVIHETTSARARPTSGQTRSNAVNTTPHSLFLSLPLGDAFSLCSLSYRAAVIVTASLPTGRPSSKRTIKCRGYLTTE
jgi:hypothetical protein